MEKDIERHLRKKVEKLGGRCLKFVSPGNSGVPDRIIIFPEGRIWFVELKKEGEQPRRIQKKWKKILEALGCHSVILIGKEEVDKWLEEVAGHEIRSARVPAQSDRKDRKE